MVITGSSDGTVRMWRLEYAPSQKETTGTFENLYACGGIDITGLCVLPS